MLGMTVAMVIMTAAPTAAQNISQLRYGEFFAANRFGVFVIKAYAGTLEWSSTSGKYHMSASATLRDGVVNCTSTETSEEGTFSASGKGLIDISLGLDPDEENPPAHPGGKMYIILATCPLPQSPPPHEASWSNEWSTYKRQNGEYDAQLNGNQMAIMKLPAELRGHWEVSEPEESRTMTWRLCLVAKPCSAP